MKKLECVSYMLLPVSGRGAIILFIAELTIQYLLKSVGLSLRKNSFLRYSFENPSNNFVTLALVLL